MGSKMGSGMSIDLNVQCPGRCFGLIFSLRPLLVVRSRRKFISTTSGLEPLVSDKPILMPDL